MNSNVDQETEVRKLLLENAAAFKWLHQESFPGFMYFEIGDTLKHWMSDSLISMLGYKDSLHMLPIPQSMLEELQRLIKDGATDQVYNNVQFEFISSDNTTVQLPAAVRIVSIDSSIKLLIKVYDDMVSDSLNTENLNLVKLNEIYEETNKIARVGGWEYDINANKLTWTAITKEIHEVPADYVPEVDSAIDFFLGSSRDKITAIFEKAVTEGLSFDVELKIVTAKGKEIWVRSFGKPEMKDGKCVRIYGAFQDIDFKKRQEIQFNLTQKRFETIFDNASVGILLTDTKDRLLMANRATLEILGFPDDDKEYMMHYLNYKDLIHPDDLEMANKYKAALLNGKLRNYTVEIRFITAEKKTVWCRLNTAMVSDDETGLIITQFEDITLAKNLERSASENSKRFEGAFEHSPNGMALVGLDGKWLLVNDALTKILGYTKEEFLQLTFQDITHPDDLKKDKSMQTEMLNNKRENYTVEKRYLHKNGTIVYGLLNVSLLKSNEGNNLYFIAQINDITKRVTAEEQQRKSLWELENLMRATTEVSIVQVDLHGTIVKFNTGAENLLGYSAEEMIGKANIGIVHDPKEIANRARELSTPEHTIQGFDVVTYKAQQGRHESREWTFIRKNGARVPVHLVITAIRDDEDKIAGYLGISTNISRFKQLEFSLNKARIKAEAASRSKSEFLANMSHEIRTPLNGVIGFTDLLMKTELDTSQRNYTQLANTSAHTLLALINDILDFSKIEAGKLELAEEPVNLLDLCTTGIDVIKHQAYSKGLELLLNISPSVSRTIFADPVRLRQVIINLLGNAVKFTEEGEIELRIYAEESVSEDGYQNFSFEIRDTGIGIAPANLKKIFNAFDQEDSSTTRRFGGSGLGITISNKLLEMMGSGLQVKSTLHKGSTFYFKVRFKVGKEDVRKITIPSAIKNILIVDDNSNNQLILRDMLAMFEIQSQVVSNGIEAIELLAKPHDFDFAIVDFNMPYMTGIDLIRHIRQNMDISRPELPIMLLHSTIEDSELIKSCRELDVDYNIAKPITSQQLYFFLNAVENKSEQISNTPNAEIPEFEKQHFKIMIAEDNPVNQILAKTLIAKILPMSDIIIAENGEKAVEYYVSYQPDLIFMDIQMPVKSGLEASKEIRILEGNGNRLPIIALTARALKGEKEECLQAGMDDYLTKPIIYENLRETLCRYLMC